MNIKKLPKTRDSRLFQVFVGIMASFVFNLLAATVPFFFMNLLVRMGGSNLAAFYAFMIILASLYVFFNIAIAKTLMKKKVYLGMGYTAEMIMHIIFNIIGYTLFFVSGNIGLDIICG